MKILALDPGKTTGWALLENTEKLLVGIVKLRVIRKKWILDDFDDWLIQFLQEHEVDVLVIEDFVFRPGFKEGKWKTAEVPQIIRSAEVIARANKIPCKKQSPAIKPVGYGMAGLKYVKGKAGTHIQDAVAHGTYYYRTEGVKLNESSRTD